MSSQRPIVLALALNAFGLSACSGSTSTSEGTAKSPTSQPTSAASKGSAPNFTLPSTTGQNVSLSDYLGKKVILVDFWATTCQPCMVELPHIVAMYEKYKEKGFVVLAVAGDGPETRAQVDAEVHAKKMTFPVLLDEETTVISRFSPKKDMPFWVLIDRSGNVVKKKNGYDPGDEKKLAEEIEKLL